MPRSPADIRISLKKRGGPTHRIELVRQPVGRQVLDQVEIAQALIAAWATRNCLQGNSA